MHPQLAAQVLEDCVQRRLKLCFASSSRGIVACVVPIGVRMAPGGGERIHEVCQPGHVSVSCIPVESQHDGANTEFARGSGHAILRW
jgi:hypothetical protein